MHPDKGGESFASFVYLTSTDRIISKVDSGSTSYLKSHLTGLLEIGPGGVGNSEALFDHLFTFINGSESLSLCAEELNV